MITRVHLLDERTLIAACKGDPTARATSLGQVKLHGLKLVDDRTVALLPREARQLAYWLCEAADDAEKQ